MNVEYRTLSSRTEADAAFLADHPPAEFLALVRRRRSRRLLSRGAALGTALAACLAVVLAAPSVFDRSGATRMKGSDLNVFVYRKTQSGVGILGPRDQLSAGDEIQISYFARGRSYAAIMSVDGRGSVTRHMPLHGDDALEIDTKEFELLPYSYRLDDAPGFEDVYLVVSPKRFTVSAVEPFLKAAYDNGKADGTVAAQLPSPLNYATVRVAKKESSE